jgi:branched-chain amino acid transport system ATP-binding protein
MSRVHSRGELASRWELRNVSVTFGGLQALRSVSLSIVAGERVGLIGPNGAGKTTFVNCLAGEIRPAGGSVLRDDLDITKWPVHKRFRYGLGRTFQIASPFPAMTVIDSVALGALATTGSARQAREQAIAALELLRIADLGKRPMRDLNSVSSKLVELARLIAANAELVILDELLAGLAPGERSFVLDVLDDLSTRTHWAVLLIEHLIHDVRRFCPRLVVLVDGEVLAEGPTDSVLEDTRVISAYLGSAWAKATDRREAEKLI